MKATRSTCRESGETTLWCRPWERQGFPVSDDEVMAVAAVLDVVLNEMLPAIDQRSGGRRGRRWDLLSVKPIDWDGAGKRVEFGVLELACANDRGDGKVYRVACRSWTEGRGLMPSGEGFRSILFCVGASLLGHADGDGDAWRAQQLRKAGWLLWEWELWTHSPAEWSATGRAKAAKGNESLRRIRDDIFKWDRGLREIDEIPF